MNNSKLITKNNKQKVGKQLGSLRSSFKHSLVEQTLSRPTKRTDLNDLRTNRKRSKAAGLWSLTPYFLLSSGITKNNTNLGRLLCRALCRAGHIAQAFTQHLNSLVENFDDSTYQRAGRTRSNGRYKTGDNYIIVLKIEKFQNWTGLLAIRFLSTQESFVHIFTIPVTIQYWKK